MTYSKLEKIIEAHHGNTLGFSRHYLTLYSIVLGMEAKNVLELGAGFSTPTILAALEHTGGNLITCDQRPIEGTGNTRELSKKYPTWRYLEGKTDDTLKEVADEKFDVVLHDASHDVLPVYRDLRKIVPLVKQNGIILIHDTEHPSFPRFKWAARLALLFTPHKKVTLPYGCGLTIIRILGNANNGKISLTWTKKRG